MAKKKSAKKKVAKKVSSKTVSKKPVKKVSKKIRTKKPKKEILDFYDDSEELKLEEIKRAPKVDAVAPILIQGMRAFFDPKRACLLAGISYSAYKSWMNKGVRDYNNGLTNSYTDFFLSITKVSLEAELDLVEHVISHGSGVSCTKIKEVRDNRGRILSKEITTEKKKDWRAAAWVLERRCTEQYGRTLKLEADELTVQEMAAQLRLAAAGMAATIPSYPKNTKALSS